MSDFRNIQALTFDCYGTLVDWETGILAGLRPVLARRGIELTDNDILERYARYEAEAEAGSYRKYADVLREVVRRFGADFGAALTEADENALADNFDLWKPFPDTIAALKELKARYRLCIVSNTDDALFAITARYLEVPFDEIVTAEQIQSYKPALQHFETAQRRLGLPRENILHVAQSVHHDIVPAKSLGIATAWVNRRHDKPGSGATVPATAQPDIEVLDLQSLANLLLAT